MPVYLTHQRRFIIQIILLAVFFVACNPAQDKTADENAPAPHFTIGLVVPHEITTLIFDQYRSKMAELGYEEGKNVTYIQKGPPEGLVQLLQYPKELVASEIDLMVVIATEGALIAQSATEEIPIIFIAGDTPIEMGLVESLERPGGNVTGVMTTGPEARRLQILLEIDPTIERLYIPHAPDDMMVADALSELEAVASDLGIVMVPEEIEDEAALAGRIQDLPADIDAIFILQDILVSSAIGDWASAAVEHKLPLSAPGVGDGGVGSPVFTYSPLMGYGLYIPDLAQKAARLSDQVLRGTYPGDLPIETAELYLMVNLDSAGAIGVEIPDHILEQAQFVNRWADQP